MGANHEKVEQLSTADIASHSIHPVRSRAQASQGHNCNIRLVSLNRSGLSCLYRQIRLQLTFVLA